MVLGGKTKLTLTTWPNYTEEKHILLHSDSLLTVCEPSQQVMDAYLKKIGKTSEDFVPQPQPELLQEEEQLPESIPFDDDDYEPRYEEIDGYNSL